MDQTDLDEYERLSKEMTRFKKAFEAARQARNDIASKYFKRDGRGHVYNIDGVDMIVSTTKSGSHYFVPKNRRRGRAVEQTEGTTPESESAVH